MLLSGLLFLQWIKPVTIYYGNFMFLFSGRMVAWRDVSLFTAKHKFVSLFAILGAIYLASFQLGTPVIKLPDRVTEEAERLKNERSA